jgi:hypothetical protein
MPEYRRTKLTGSIFIFYGHDVWPKAGVLRALRGEWNADLQDLMDGQDLRVVSAKRLSINLRIIRLLRPIRENPRSRFFPSPQ